jgi:tetratricopeptide (TPR) repeat protein
MKVLEADLSGESNMILYTNLNEQRKLFSAVKSMSGVKIAVWEYPFRAKFDQLFKYELIGRYLEIFKTTNPVKKQHNFPLWSGRIQYFKGEITGQGGAMTCYQDARISDREMMELRAVPEIRNNRELLQILQLTTNQAVFWIGIASFERNAMENAKDSMKGLLSSSVNAWAVSESYILGRIAEQEKNYAEAINHYERAAQKTTQKSAFDIRTKWLREKTK